MHFGAFMYFQDRGLDTARLYQEHLAEIELMEELGFDEVWLAEHHFTHYGMLPSPNLMLATVAARTHRIRLGNMVNTLPFYDPLRLAEEVAMLDHLSSGRLNLGIGSGVLREFSRRGLAEDDAKPRFYEGLEVLIKAFTNQRFDHDGRFWHFHDAELTPRPLQLPYPPIVVATNSLDSVRWCAARQLPYAQMNSTVTEVRESADAYRADLKGGSGAPFRGPRLFRPIYIAETTAQARAEAAEAYFRFLELWSGSTTAVGDWTLPDAWRHHTGLAMRRLGPKTFDELDEGNALIVGDPDRVGAKLEAIVGEIGGLDALVGTLAFGSLTHEQVCRSLRLFATHVMPALRADLSVA